MTSVFSKSNITSSSWGSTVMKGNKAVLGSLSGSSSGLHYSSDYGQTWTISNISNNFTYVVNMDGQYVIAASSGGGVLYSDNYGVFYSQSTSSTPNFNTSSFTPNNNFRPQMYLNYAIVVRNGTNLNAIFYSTDYGATWTESIADPSSGAIPPIGAEIMVAMSGMNAIAGTAGNSGLYYSTNAGQTWKKSAIYPNSRFDSLALSGLVGIGSGRGGTTTNIYRTTNGGETWGTTTGASAFNYPLLHLNGLFGIAGRGGATGVLLRTQNGGSSWSATTSPAIRCDQLRCFSFENNVFAVTNFQSAGVLISNNIAATTISWTNYTTIGTSYICENPSISGSKCITTTNTNVGAYYNSTGTLCYEKNVKILCLNGSKQFIKICDLKKDMMVKTYKHGYKKITHIKGFKYTCNNTNDDLQCLYKMKNKDIILTGGHSLLVDTLTDEQQNNKHNFKEMIEDKHLLLTCLNENFEKLTETKEYELFHLVLENEDEYHHYGIYIDDYILSETCSRNAFEQRL
jgi:photosystem II stability/assembly factor-like uncharacterized protein